MPTADNDGVAVEYEVAESGDPDAETVVLLADAGYGPWLWSWQYPALAGPYRVVVPSPRGTGGSEDPGTYAVAEQAADLDAVLADCNARKAHLVGAGLGGMVALRYALDFSRARSLTLLGTSAGGPRADPVPDDVRERLLVGNDDPEALRRSLEPVASEELLETDDLVERIVAWRRAEDADREARRGHLDAMAAFDASDDLYEVTIPALVMHGREDRVVPVEDGRLLAEGLPKGEFREFPGGHLFFVERSKEVNDALVGFLEEHGEE
ncbi:alpha/beta hydrolase [Halorussus salilacus]|uniref:alpha/beta fold hydrolase n=1 Tax=Halorussus salilacus TaxID=2953750 RepID=UPI00209EBBD8|nr:alpha/beta hydrolase [Halorussus salilacus]USZ69594.1 alpha/beta hydrolase [Halorussus salilacus]